MSDENFLRMEKWHDFLPPDKPPDTILIALKPIIRYNVTDTVFIIFNMAGGRFFDFLWAVGILQCQSALGKKRTR